LPAPGGDPGQDRRRSERLRLRARAWCAAQGLTVYGRVGNLSASGIFLLSAAPLAPGTRVQVAIPIPEERELVADAEVVWSRDAAPADDVDGAADRGASGLAARFLSLSDDDARLISTLLAHSGRAV
jgi:hypothetical protein